MMDVNDIDRLADLGAQDLHVARHDEQLDVFLLNNLQQLALRLGLGLLGDWNVMERNAVRLGQRAEVGMIRDDCDYRDR